MKCDVCGKKDALAMITMIVNGKNSVRRVCPDCMKKLQRGDAYAAQMAIMSTMETPEREIVCPVCGASWSQVCKSGRVGCASCYDVFSERLQPLMVRMNGIPQHAGKEPEEAPSSQNDIKTEVGRLREEMFSAVSSEDYERAAQLRDQIRMLEKREGGEQG